MFYGIPWWVYAIGGLMLFLYVQNELRRNKAASDKLDATYDELSEEELQSRLDALDKSDRRTFLQELYLMRALERKRQA